MGLERRRLALFQSSASTRPEGKSKLLLLKTLAYAGQSGRGVAGAHLLELLS